MPNPYGWGQNEPQIKPKDQGGDTISTFAAKIKDAITSLFNTLNSYPWSNATQSASGYMSKEDKTALDNVPTTYLPLSGGTLIGDITTKNIIMSSGAIRTLLDSHALYQYGGTGWQHGAQITLFGKDHSTNPGDFTIHADNGTNSCDLFGRPNGTLLWNGNKVVTDNVETITPTFDTSHFKPYNDYSSYKPTLKKMGKVCMVRGVISPLAEIPAGGMDFATIPSGYRPPLNVFTLCQGSGAYKWLLTITGDTGAMNISRYSVSTWNGDPIPAGSWLPFTVTYICA